MIFLDLPVEGRRGHLVKQQGSEPCQQQIAGAIVRRDQATARSEISRSPDGSCACLLRLRLAS
jgi:hypothetical protein